MSEHLRGIITGVIATIIGFGLSMTWDTYKYNRDVKQIERQVLAAFKYEVETNLHILKYNQALLQNEIKVLDKKKSMVAPLKLLDFGSWDLMKLHPPRSLVKVKKLVMVRRIAQLSDEMNEQIRSRENYRIHNQATTNRHAVLKIYDGLLLKRSKILLELLVKL